MDAGVELEWRHSEGGDPAAATSILPAEKVIDFLAYLRPEAMFGGLKLTLHRC